MAALIEREIDDAAVELIKGSRGDFIVTVDGEQIWDKRAMGGFPNEEAIVDQLAERG